MKKIFISIAAALFCTTISAQQLNESFEGEQFPPEGWEVINGSQYNAWAKTAKEGRVCAVVPGTFGYESYLITPQLKPAAGEKLQFSARIGDYSAKGELRVEVSLAGTDKESFTVLDTYYTSRDAESNAIPKSDWKDFSIDLSVYKNQRIFIAFHQYGEADKIFLDDVKGVTLSGSETCDVPTNVVVSNITSDGATVSWEGASAEFQYVVVARGEELDWNGAQKTSEKSVVLTGLDEEQAYDFYVRSYCSDEEQSLAPKVAFKTVCEANDIPWLETFTRDATGAVEPECWTVASANPQVWVVADKTYDDEGKASVVSGQALLCASGGGPNTEQVFALPTFNAQLNKLELAFDYKTSLTSDGCGVPEVGYMTNPSKASTFVSVKTLERTLNYQHAVVTLEDLPADAQFIAIRFAGGTSDLCELSMDNFIVAEIGKSKEVDPSQEEVPDAAIYGQTYCEAQFTWYSYNASAFAIGLFSADSQQLVGGIVVTTGECDRFAYQDGIGFPEDDDYENHYYCSTKWILNIDDAGISKGDAWDACVYNVGTAASPVLGLNPGKYQVQVYAYTEGASSMGELLATIPFELVEKKVADLKAEVAADKKTATLSWVMPELASGERAYVSVRSGETVAYDNFESKDAPVSPLTVEVEEGKSYTATIQIIDKKKEPLGREVQCDFTVGVNNYEPKNPHAEVFGGDNVTFSWEAGELADFYTITLYWNGEFYATLNVVGATEKTTTMPKDGTWTWTVQAFNQGANGNYFPASNAIEGNSFVSKAADVPEDAVVFDIWAFEAAYLDENSGYYIEGKHGWFLQFATGEEGNQLPGVYFLVYTNKENAISGVYNVSRTNIDLESCYIDLTGKQADAVNATDAEIRLQFDGYDEEKAESGHRYGYYTGEFRLVGDNGKTYIGKFMEMFCNSYNFSSMSTGILDHKGMWDEDPDYTPWGVENIQSDKEQSTKVLRDGALYIVMPDGAVFNTTGVRVK